MNISYTTERLRLTTLKAHDADMVLDFYNRNRSHFEPWEAKRSFNFYTLSYQRTSLAFEERLMKRNNMLRFWIYLKDRPDSIIGTINYYNIKEGKQPSCQIGYKIDHEHTKMGYAYEAIQYSMSEVIERYNLHRIEAKIMPSNLPSINLIQKLGFKYEGLAKLKIKINGNWQDHLLYAYTNKNKLKL